MDNDDNIKSIDVVSNFKVDDSFVHTYRTDERIVREIKKYFPKLPGKYVPFIFDQIFTSRPINFLEFLPKEHFLFDTIRKKIDDKFTVLPTYYHMLRNALITLLNTIAKGFENASNEKKEVIVVDGKNCLRINKTHAKDELFKWFCDENGDVCFKYDFDHPDLDFSVPKTNNELQLVKIQITSMPIIFGLVVEHKYSCPDKSSPIPEEVCDSPDILSRKAYEVESVKDRLECTGHKHSIGRDGRLNSRLCGKSLYPIEKMSRFVDAYYVDINYEDETGLMQSSSAFSFTKIMPGFYDAVLFSYTGNLKSTNYQIVDVKPIPDVIFVMPEKELNKNYIITLQESIDNFIKQQTGQTIYGLIPMKLALIIQKLANVLDFPLRLGVDFSGEKSCGKSLLLKYYGIILYNYANLSTNGLSVSVPALRGTTDKAYVLNKEININRIGFLGTYRSIHIDEVGENVDLVQHLKIFLSEANYSNNMARADSATRKRIAHVNITKNLNHEHLGQYRGSIKKIYDALDARNEVPKDNWNSNWDLFQPLDRYDNPYLKECVRRQREKLTNEQKYWIDGCDLALHDRFPFYFYVEDDSNKNLKEVLKENATKKKIEEITQLIKQLKNSDIEEYFKSLREFDVDVSKDIFNEVENILNKYSLVVDSRITDVYYMLIKLSMILNKRYIPNHEDYELLTYFLENINRKVTTTEIEKYHIRGVDSTLPQHFNSSENKTTINDFKILTGDDDVMSDFK